MISNSLGTTPASVPARASTNATNASEASTAPVAEAPATDFARSLDAAAASLETPIDPAPAATAASAKTPAVDASAAPTDGLGWPPAGLASLFTAAVASAKPSQNATPTASTAASMLDPGAATLAIPAFSPAMTITSAKPSAVLSTGLLGSAQPSQNAAPSPALTLIASSAATRANAVPASPPASPIAATAASMLDPIAAALVRQHAPLLKVRDEASSSLTTLMEVLAPERASDASTPLSSVSPLAASTAKLDLAQAFPAPVPMPSPRFAEDLGARLQWMAERQGGEATLRIAPEGLGPVEIRLKLDGDRVELGFQAAHYETRQALEQALPRLREMLSEHGLQLGHADVGQNQTSNAQGEASPGLREGESEGNALEGEPALRHAALQIGRSERGLLDLYA